MAPALKSADELVNTFVDEQVQILIPQLEKLALIPDLDLRRAGTGRKMKGAKSAQKLASETAATLKAVYPDSQPEDEREYKTAAGQVSKLKKALNQAAGASEDKAMVKPLQTTITLYGDALSFLFSEYRARTNSAYVRKVRERSSSDERVEIDPTEYLQRAYTVLGSIAAGENLFDWLDVSCSLAMTTGRRMAEIHLSATFEPVAGESHMVTYRGQLKGKNRRVHQTTLTDVTPYDLAKGDTGLLLRDVAWQIPTLIPAELVVSGLAWLAKKSKRFPQDVDPVRVNGRWSKVLNERAKDWSLFEGMTYHKFRAAFFVCAVANAQTQGLAGIDVENFASLTLCDRDKLSLDAYKRFNLKPGCKTKI